MVLRAVLVAALLAAPTADAAPGKPCETARKKVDREQRSVAQAADSIARDRAARETCTTRSQCARYDAAIADTERTKIRHESRLARFNAEVGQNCATP